MAQWGSTSGGAWASSPTATATSAAAGGGELHNRTLLAVKALDAIARVEQEYNAREGQRTASWATLSDAETHSRDNYIAMIAEMRKNYEKEYTEDEKKKARFVRDTINNKTPPSSPPSLSSPPAVVVSPTREEKKQEATAAALSAIRQRALIDPLWRATELQRLGLRKIAILKAKADVHSSPVATDPRVLEGLHDELRSVHDMLYALQ